MGRAEIKRIPRLRTVMLLFVERLQADKVQFMAPLSVEKEPERQPQCTNFMIYVAALF